jgi:hypothetical protein
LGRTENGFRPPDYLKIIDPQFSLLRRADHDAQWLLNPSRKVDAFASGTENRPPEISFEVGNQGKL